MKKTNNIKTRIIAGLLSTVTAFSVGVIAISSASAAEVNSTEYILQQNDANNPVSFATVTAEDYGKQAGVDAANAAFDTLGQVFPGASILVSPFKSLFNMNVKGDDPMTAVNNKLDKMDQKLDDISKDLKSLNNNIDRNTAWIGNKTELSELKTNYRNLSAALEDFAKDVYAIESDDELNNQQKTMKLATLKKGADFKDVKRYCTIIRDYMDGSNKYVSDCMFDLLYNDKAVNCMVDSEAYKEAFGAAEDLTKQYMYAVSLLAECQKAADAVYFFKEADVKALGNGSFKSDYDNFDKAREILDADDASKMLTAAAEGSKKFIRHNTGKLIFKATKNIDYFCGRSESANLFDNRVSETTSFANKSALSTDDIKALAEYVRTNYPDTSVYDFLKNNNALCCANNLPASGKGYLLTDTQLETKESDGGTEGLGEYGGYLLYNCSVYAKGIDIYDPKCEEQSFLVFTYRRADEYVYFIHCSSRYYNYINYTNNIVTLGAPVGGKEKQEMTSYENYLTWRESIPGFMGMSYADYKKFENWKNDFKDYNYDDQYFIDYLKCEELYIKYRLSYLARFIQYMDTKLNPKTANAPFEWYERYTKDLSMGENRCYRQYLANVYHCG